MAKAKSVKIPKNKAIYYAKKDILGRSLAKAKANKEIPKAFAAMAKKKAKKMAGWKAIKNKIKQ